MGKSRRKFSLEFKLEAVKQIVEQGRSVSEVAESLGVHANSLSSWKTKFLADGSLLAPSGEQADLVEEVRKLRRELKIAQQEREILKKAAAYFANAKD